MLINVRIVRRLILLSIVLIALSLVGCSTGRSSATGKIVSYSAAVQTGTVKTIEWNSSGLKSERPLATQKILVDGDATSAASQDATSAASESAESGGEASEESAHCLKCHGPFDTLAEKTKDYVTEWDEVANPHVFVPHESTTIVDCSECHDNHAIPFVKDESARKPNVQYCYSCHHAETLAHCNECHNH